MSDKLNDGILIDNWNPDDEEKYMLALAPILKDIGDVVKAKLPPGIDFGVIVCVPSPNVGELGRVLAITTDRERVSFAAAQWCMNVHYNRGQPG